MSQKTETEVLYNASCPICRREVGHYAKLSAEQALPITYADLNAPEQCADWGVTPDAAARRFHVRKDGRIYDGLPAFEILWRDIPRYRWLAKFISLPVIHRLAVWTYDLILAPALYANHKRRQAKLGCQPSDSASR